MGTKIKWQGVSRIGYDAGCTGRVFEDDMWRYEAVWNRPERTWTLFIGKSGTDERILEQPFESLETLETFVIGNFLKKDE